MRSSFSEAMRGGGVVPCVRRSAKQCEVEELSNAFVVQRSNARWRSCPMRSSFSGRTLDGGVQYFARKVVCGSVVAEAKSRIRPLT